MKSLSGITFITVLSMFNLIACGGGDADNGKTNNIGNRTEQIYASTNNASSNYEIEGTITSIVDSQSFYLSGILVTHGSSNRFEYGNVGDLTVGRRVEAEGTRTNSGTVIAREIEFEDDD